MFHHSYQKDKQLKSKFLSQLKESKFQGLFWGSVTIYAYILFPHCLYDDDNNGNS